MSADVIDFRLQKRLRAIERARRLPLTDCVYMHIPGGGFELVPRSEFTAQELADIDWLKKECDL
jgi:hypothetical protein